MRINVRKLGSTLSWLAAVAMLASALAAVPVWAAYGDTYVDDDAGYQDNDGDEYFATIQAAIDNTSSGGTVHVADGSYPEKLTIDNTLVLKGEEGAYPLINPVLTGTARDSIISPEADDITITGFEIANGDLEAVGESVERHGIWKRGEFGVGPSGLTVEDCIIHHIQHGVRSYGDDLTVQNCEMHHLKYSGVEASGPTSAEGGSDQPLSMTISNNWFHDWAAYSSEGKGVEIKYGNRVGEVSYNYISGMRMGIGYYYGGPQVGYGQMVIKHNTMDLDYDPGDGPVDTTMGISLWGTGSNAGQVVIRDNIFANAMWYGIYQEGAEIEGSITVDNNLFYNNYWYYWPNYQYPYQWFGADTRAQAGWYDGPADGFAFTNNITVQDPLFVLSEPGAEGQWALQYGSPAAGTASDGTNIGAWQGTPTSPDDEGPVASQVVAHPSPVEVDGSVTVSANVDDSDTGGSSIASAEYRLDGGSWMSMQASDGAFDAVSEDVEAGFAAPDTPEIYDLCVRGTDAAGNTGPEECVMLVVYDPDGGFVTGGGWIESPADAYKLPDKTVESVVFFNGFETNTDGWYEPARVASGTNGILSASGDYHAEATGDFTRWGGYNSTFPSGGYVTAVDVYLDVNGGFSNDTRFDWTSAISAPDGNHRRDFVFNGGFYSDDDDSPGSGLNRFVFSAGNNAGRANSYPKNPGHDPIAITESGWYTLRHRFYDSGGGVLAVDLSIIGADGNTIHTWTLSDPEDVIGDTVGGNRYGWFATNEFLFLAIDNSKRVELTGPTGRASFGFVSKYKKGANVPTGNTEFQFKAADLNFHSSSYDWLVVTGSDYAKFKGSGTINNELAPTDEEYKFQLWAGDGDPDTFRIKIWWEEGETEHVVYDNGMDQEIGGGSIVVHAK